MSDAPPQQPPPSGPRFRVVAGSDVVKPTKSPATNTPTILQPPPQRIRYVRPMERLVYARPPPGYYAQRSEMPFSQQPTYYTSQPVRRPTIIRQPIARIIRPLIPGTSNNPPDNKKKLVDILKSFLSRCSKTPESNLPQMILTTEQYLQGVVTTPEYMQVLHQNVRGVRENLAAFLEAYIHAVRRDIKERKVLMEEVLPYRLAKIETSQNSPSFQQQQYQPQTTTTYSTPSPLIETTFSNEQQPRSIKCEPMSVSSNHSEQYQQVQSPLITSSNNSATYQTAKMEPGSSRSSPILRTSSSPHFQIINKSYGSVGEQPQHRASPLTISRDMQPKTSPLAATTAPTMDIQTTPAMSYQEQQQPMELQMPPQDTYITPEQPSQSQTPPQPVPQTSEPQQKEPEIPDDTPLTELPHEIALQRSLIDPATFSALMQRKVPGITIESPAFLMISEFLETKIKKLISNARLAAEHRSEQFRGNPDYVEAENPRAQLNAIEKLEKAEKQLKIDMENEKLSRNAKNDSNKVKEIVKTIEDENLNRDANEAAMSAIGGKKRTWQSRKADGNESGGGPAAKKAAIARAKQISMKDLLFAFEKDSFAKDSIVYRKVLYGLYSDNKN